MVSLLSRSVGCGTVFDNKQRFTVDFCFYVRKSRKLLATQAQPSIRGINYVYFYVEYVCDASYGTSCLPVVKINLDLNCYMSVAES